MNTDKTDKTDSVRQLPEASVRYGNRIRIERSGNGFVVFTDGKLLTRFDFPLEGYLFTTEFQALRAGEQRLDAQGQWNEIRDNRL